MNLAKRDFAPRNVPPTSRRQGSPFCRQDAGSTLRFILDLQDRTRIGAMNRAHCHKPLECAGRAQRRRRFSVERGA